MNLYKLTDQNGQTKNGTQWGPGVTHTAQGKPGQDLCSDGWIHAYEHPLLAVLLNPIHANFAMARLWEATGHIGKRDGQLKCGCRSLTTVKEMPLPKITEEQMVRFAIGCAWPSGSVTFRKWATGWLSGKDRTAAAMEWAAAAEAWAVVAATEWAVVAATEWAVVAATEWAVAAEAAAEAAAIDLIRIAEWVVTNDPIEALYP